MKNNILYTVSNSIADAVLEGNLQLVNQLLKESQENEKILAEKFYWVVNNAIDNNDWIPLVQKCISTGAKFGQKVANMQENVMDLALKSNNLLLKQAMLNTLNDNGETQLHFIVGKNATKFIENFIANGADINVKDKDGLTSFYKACILKNENIVNLLVKYKPNINSGDLKKIYTLGGAEIMKKKYGAEVKNLINRQQLLHSAVVDADLDLVKACMYFDADQNSLNEQGFTPLYLACTKTYNARKNNEKQKEESLQAIAEILCDNENQPDFNLFSKITSGNQNALSWLSELKNPKILEKFVQLKVMDINIKDGDGKTLLSWMVQYAAKDQSWNDMIKVLVENGADANICRNDFVSPLDIAVISNNQIAVKLLASKSDSSIVKKALNIASNYKFDEIIKIIKSESKINDLEKVDLVQKSNESNESNEKLFALLNKGQVNLSEMQQLIQSGADVNLKNSKSTTPLFISCLGKSKTLVEWLLNQPKIDLIHTEGSGNNGLSLIADLKDVDLLNKAIKTCGENKSIVINNKDNNGKTLLSWMVQNAAADQSYNDMIKLLVENDADANICRNDFVSPLEIAVMSKNHNAIKLLVPKSSAVIVQKSLMLAISNEYEDIASVIIEAGENNQIEDEYNQTSVYLEQNFAGLESSDNNSNLDLSGNNADDLSDM